jgi:hypothetical protein
VFTSSVQAQGLFDSTDLQQVLYKDALHAYDDDQVILLSRQRVPQLTSRLVPVQAGDEISFSTYVHYSSGSANKTWQRIGAAAAGLAIGSLPHLLDRNKANQEGGAGNDLIKKAAPLVGAGVAALPFVLNKRKGKVISKNPNMPKSKNGHRGNGLFVPDAYLRYTFYDQEGQVLSSEVRSIDKHAKDAWQQLSLKAVAPQDGYVRVEVGNSSKRPVWMDGMELRKRGWKAAPSKNKRVNNLGVSTPVINRCFCSWVCVYSGGNHYCYEDCDVMYCDDPDRPQLPNPDPCPGGCAPPNPNPGPGGGGSPGTPVPGAGGGEPTTDPFRIPPSREPPVNLGHPNIGEMLLCNIRSAVITPGDDYVSDIVEPWSKFRKNPVDNWLDGQSIAASEKGQVQIGNYSATVYVFHHGYRNSVNAQIRPYVAAKTKTKNGKTKYVLEVKSYGGNDTNAFAFYFDSLYARDQAYKYLMKGTENGNVVDCK